ncbi:MAG: helix-turn-helix domain-containing protein [Solirubrobacteraceae bacterium]
MRSAEIVKALRADKVSQAELACRAGVARETISRWESGAAQPSLESLVHLARSTGAALDMRLIVSEPELVALAEDQLELEPLQRLKALVGDDWSGCRRALSVAADLGEPALLIGPVAAALCGVPQRPVNTRVQLLLHHTDLERIEGALFDMGGWPDGGEETTDGTERRGRWRVGRAKLTVRTHTTGVKDIAALHERSWRLSLDRRGERHLNVASVPGLLQIAEHSGWSEDVIYRSGLRALLVCEHYRSKHGSEQQGAAA